MPLRLTDKEKDIAQFAVWTLFAHDQRDTLYGYSRTELVALWRKMVNA